MVNVFENSPVVGIRKQAMTRSSLQQRNIKAKLSVC